MTPFQRGWSGLGPTNWELQELAGRSGVRSDGDSGGGQLHVVLVDKRTGLAGGGEELGMSSMLVAGTPGSGTICHNGAVGLAKQVGRFGLRCAC